MIKNSLRSYIEKSGLSQREIAARIKLNTGLLSQVVTGQSMLEYVDLESVCEIVGCKPADVYDEAIMDAVYHVSKAPKKLSTTVSVRIPRVTADEIDSRLVDAGLYLSRNEAVNAILMAYLRK